MRRIEKILLVLLTGLIVGCTKETHDIPELDLHPNNRLHSDQFLTDEEASEQAVQLYSALFDTGLRGMHAPRVLDVKRTGGLRGLNQEDESGVVVVNFEGNKGYVVMSASKFNEPIIAACDNGYLDPNVPMTNPNLLPILANTDAILVHNEENRLLTDLVDHEGRPLPNLIIPDTTSFIPRCIEGPWEAIREVKPLVKVEWGQRAPYNLGLKPIDGQLPPTGCTATAAAQIMSYHKHPLEYNWDAMITYLDTIQAKTSFASLFLELGKPENLNMRYTPKESGARSANAPRTFRNFGYESGELIAYDESLVEREIIEERRPVYVRGNATKYTFQDGLRYLTWGNMDASVAYAHGHAWVIDGYKMIKKTYSCEVLENNKIKVIEEASQVKYLVHCNFGWSGRGNGYYLHKAFHSKKGLPEGADAEPPVNDFFKGLINKGFQFEKEHKTGVADLMYNHEIITNIKPK